MRKDHHKQPQDRPRIVDKMLLARSTARHVDGVWIGSWRTPEDLTRVEHALLLIKQYSPLHYSRIVNDLERIWIFLLPDGLAGYNHSLEACVLDERFVAEFSNECRADRFGYRTRSHARKIGAMRDRLQ